MRSFVWLMLIFSLYALSACDKNSDPTSHEATDGDLDRQDTPERENTREGEEGEENPRCDWTSEELELYRAAMHFSPQEGWMNDPNGLIYVDGVFHLFFQYAPDGFIVSPIHWGHATATNLLDFNEQAIALYPSETLGQTYSGGGVFDKGNTSGLCTDGKGCIVLFFTHSGGESRNQKQSLAYSNDGGQSFQEYENNPIIENPGRDDFRDPKVVWIEEENAWLMVVSGGEELLFYRSSDLLDWRQTGALGLPAAIEEGLYECPDLFRLPVQGDESGAKKWVMKVDLLRGLDHPSGAIYWVGDLEDFLFAPDGGLDAFRTVDAGADFYAAQSFENTWEALGERYWIAWMNNWRYAASNPSEPFQGMMTLPRALSLVASDEAGRPPILAQRIVDTLSDYAMDAIISKSELPIEETTAFDALVGITNEAQVRPPFLLSFTIPDGQKGSIRFFDCEERAAVFRFDKIYGRAAFDRRATPASLVNDAFVEAIHETNDLRKEGALDVEIFVDRASVEIFLDGGKLVFSELLFPPSDCNKFTLTPIDRQTPFTLEDVTLTPLCPTR